MTEKGQPRNPRRRGVYFSIAAAGCQRALPLFCSSPWDHCAPQLPEGPRKVFGKTPILSPGDSFCRGFPSRIHLPGKLAFCSSKASTCWIENLQLPIQVRERIRVYTLHSLSSDGCRTRETEESSVDRGRHRGDGERHFGALGHQRLQN